MRKILLITLVLTSVSLFAQDTIVKDTTLKKNIAFPFSVKPDSTYIINRGPFSILPFSFSGYEWSSSLPLFLPFLFESHYNKKGAKRDIKTNKMKVLFPCVTIESAMELNNLKDKDFQKKYQVEFFRQSYEHNSYLEDEKAYNQTIFTYLDEKYGQEWRFEMRNDAIGFEIPDSLFKKKAEEVMDSLPEMNLEEYVKKLPLRKPLFSTPLIPALGIPAIFLSLAAIFFIFRRKKKSK